MRFIRKNGRVVPIKDGGAGNKKPSAKGRQGSEKAVNSAVTKYDSALLKRRQAQNKEFMGRGFEVGAMLGLGAAELLGKSTAGLLKGAAIGAGIGVAAGLALSSRRNGFKTTKGDVSRASKHDAAVKKSVKALKRSGV